MHVLWINRRADVVGGAERYVHETVALLRARGVRSTLIFGVEGWMEPATTSRFDAAFPMVDLPRQLAELSADVAYVHQVDDAPAVLRALHARSIPVVRFFHDHALFCLREHKYTTLRHETCTRPIGLHCYPCLGFVGRARAGGGLRLRTLSALEAEQRVHRELAAVIVGSSYMRDHVVAHGFDPRRVHALPLFVRDPAVADGVPRATAEVLFVGALLRGKGLDTLIDALARLPREVTLRVVGEGAQRALFEARASSAGVSDRVRFDGALRGEALTAAYARATCLAIPSRSPETFSLVGPEALLHETPVVATDVGGVREWLEDGVTGLAVPSNDPRALARAIERIVRDPELGRALARAGRARCLERLSPERHAATLLDVLDAARRRG